MTATVENAIKDLRGLKDSHFPIGTSLLSGRYQYKLDQLAIAVLDRSLALLRGFCDLVEARNMVSAAPLLRCQLDNGLRFYAATLVNDPDEFAWKVRSGIPVRKIKDRSGRLMHDAYLVERMTEEREWQWVETLYKQASGYVHLSEKHIFNSIPVPDEDGTTTIKITGYDGVEWTEELYLQAIEAFETTTEMVIDLVEGWAVLRVEKIKNIPKDVAQEFERRCMQANKT